MDENIRLRRFGPADNQAYYNAWLRSDEIFDTLFLSNINYAPYVAGDYSDQLLPTMSYLAWYGRQLSLKPNTAPISNKLLSCVWADLMGPMINTDKIPGQAEARMLFVLAVKALIVDPVMLDTCTTSGSRTYITIENNTQEEWDSVANATRENMPDIRIAMKILRHLADGTLTNFKIGGVGMIVHVYLALLKKGNISEPFSDKISAGLATDLQILNFRVNIDACKMFYSHFGSYVNENNIGQITAHWSALLPVNALRLRLTVMQASGSGLTALSVTGRAIRSFDNFGWARIRQLYPDEWNNFVAAVTAVGNNPWYGFKKDLGVVASTKYKNLTYVAKELMIKVNGESSLMRYGGWTRIAKFQGTVDKLIADYELAKTNSVLQGTAMPGVADDDHVTLLRDLIMNAPDVYV